MTLGPGAPADDAPRLIYRVLCGFLLMVPFGLYQPGLPSGLKADEAAYYMMATSLAYDGDVRLEAKDTARLFEEFSTRRTHNTVVMSNDGWQTVYYGKPHLYSLLAAPFVRLFGYRGMVLFNLLLFVGLLGFLSSHLGRTERPDLALAFSALFLGLGATWIYVFWIQPEILSMFAVGGSLALGLRRRNGELASSPAAAATFWSGVLLAIAAYNKPYVAPLALVFLVGAWQHSRSLGRASALRWIGTWSAGLVLFLALAAGSSWLLTGSSSSYVGVDRDSVVVCAPGEEPRGPAALVAQQILDQRAEQERSADASGGTVASSATEDSAVATIDPPLELPTKSWTWIFRIPPVTLGETLENVAYFFIGRHTGLLLYFPFAGVALLFFAMHGWRLRRARISDPLQAQRWTLLLTLFAIAFLLLVFISWNWQGGGGFVGNRYYVPLVPAFAFLVSRVRPVRALVAGSVGAGLLIGPLLLSPLGMVTTEPTLQAHTRSGPLSVFPLELTLKNVPGYEAARFAGMRLLAPADRWLPRGESFWTQGMGTTKMTVMVEEPQGATTFLVRGLTSEPRPVHLSFGGAEATVTVAASSSQTVTLTPKRSRRRHNPDHRVWTVYDLEIASEGGALMPWQRAMPPNTCPQFVRNDVYQETFFAGSEVTILGSSAILDRDVFAASLRDVVAPTSATVGQRFPVEVTLINTSQASWTPGQPARVKMAYHWLSSDGEMLDFDGLRTELGDRPVGPGSSVEITMQVAAPEAPGTYWLELDPVFEGIGWFSQHGVATHRVRVVVGGAKPTR